MPSTNIDRALFTEWSNLEQKTCEFFADRSGHGDKSDRNDLPPAVQASADEK
jgi:hypothetical protein